jgi:hypothetical protein
MMTSSNYARKFTAGSVSVGLWSKKQTVAACLESVREIERKRRLAKHLMAEYYQFGPVPAVILCPDCRQLHIDEEGAPPHDTHLCLNCGAVWNPSPVPTYGMADRQSVEKAQAKRKLDRLERGTPWADESHDVMADIKKSFEAITTQLDLKTMSNSNVK